MPKSNSITLMTRDAMADLGITRAPKRGVPGGLSGPGRHRDELAKRFRHHVRSVMADAEILALIRERLVKELRGEAEVKISPTLMKIAAGMYYQRLDEKEDPVFHPDEIQLHFAHLSDEELEAFVLRGVRPRGLSRVACSLCHSGGE